MLRHLLSFERRLLLRNGVFWIVMLVFGLLAFGSMASDDISFGGGVGNILRNAPAVVISLLGSFSVLAVLLTTIFVAGIALRDFEQRTAELFFATPMRKRDYLLGRFGGGFMASLAIMLATALGLWLGSLMPQLDQARLGPTPRERLSYGRSACWCCRTCCSCRHCCSCWPPSPARCSTPTSA